MPKKKPKLIDHDKPERPQPKASPPRAEKKRIRRKSKKSEPLSDLERIYVDDGTLPDMTKLERKKRSPRAVLLGLILFFAILAGVAWIGFFVFQPYARFEGKGVELAIEGPKEVKAGEAVRYEFEYKNTERVGLAALELRLIVPEEFHVLEHSIEPTTEPYTWTLGNLAHNGTGKIMLRGFFLGPDQGRSAFQSIATYRPANFNADFQSITTNPVAINESVLSGTLEGPTEAAPGEDVVYTYTLTHTGQETLENLEVSIEGTDSFLFDSAEPEPSDERPTRWLLQPLEPNDEVVITVHGAFAATAKGMTEVPFVIGVVKNDALFTHRRDVIETDVLAGDLSFKLVINGTTKDFPADYGETLNASLAYENQGERTIGDLTISLRINASPVGLIDWESAVIEPDARIRNGVITWTGREWEALGQVRPGEEGTIDLSLPITSEAPRGEGTDELRFSGSALISTLDGRLVARQVATPPIVVNLNSDFAFNAGAEYFDDAGAQVGSGALPPEVGTRTTATIYWDIANTHHALENIRVRATLPAHIEWTGRSRTDAGDLSWNESNRTVTLTLDELAADGVVTTDFDVALTPIATDVGKFVTLIGEISASARDTVTGATLSRARAALSSELLTNEAGESRGVVVE
jgi:hypothetical protein